MQGVEENAAELRHELELKKTELSRVGFVASRALAREVGSLKEEGTVPFAVYKGEASSAIPYTPHHQYGTHVCLHVAI